MSGGAEALPTLPKLPRRSADAHKGSCGRVGVIGGCANGASVMLGAPALVGLGAFRAGAGLVSLACVPGVLEHAIVLCPSATGVVLPVDGAGVPVPHECAGVVDALVETCRCLVVGPGLGMSGAQREATQALALRCVQQTAVPVVVDADALSALAQVPELTRDLRGMCILTPHPGEFARLARPLGITLDPTHPAQRPAAAEALAQKLGCIVVLKGAHSVVTDGHTTWVCGRGHPCLATAGTGDVLSGVIAGLAAQCAAQVAGSARRDEAAADHASPDIASPDLHALARARLASIGSGEFAAGVAGTSQKPASRHTEAHRPGLSLRDVACLGVQAHALAGEAWANETGCDGGMTAMDLTGFIARAVQGLRAAD